MRTGVYKNKITCMYVYIIRNELKGGEGLSKYGFLDKKRIFLVEASTIG